MSKEVEFYDSGFGEFEKMMKEYAEKVSEGKALDAIEAGAQEFVNDLLRLPKPRSRITKADTHTSSIHLPWKELKAILKLDGVNITDQCWNMERERWL